VGVRGQVHPERARPSPCPSPERERGPASHRKRRFDFEFRAIGADDAGALARSAIAFATETLATEMAGRDPSCGVEIAPLIDYPGLETAVESELVTLAKRLAGRNGHAKVSFGTEGGLFQALGDVPAVVIGPGSIARAHKADEFITLAELDACAAFVRRLIADSRAG
ncbi:MAG: M20/M25/M40 family metallo-hydrolase, partial [Methylobacterium sp.]